MGITRRKFQWLLGASALSAYPNAPASADVWPVRPLRLISPYAAGGSSDAIARLLARGLADALGKQVIVENKGGAGGIIGAQAAAQADPDGYTLLLGAPFLVTNPAIYPSLPFNALTDLAPLTLVSSYPNLMAVPNSSPAKSVQEFIAHAKANPGKVTFASSGVGASPHLSGELFRHMAGIDLVHVAYRGGGPVLNDLIPGRVDAYFGNLPTILPQVRGGLIRGLGVTSPTRFPIAMEIPTIAESGLPGYDVTTWQALFAPAKTPQAILEQIHRAARVALTQPDVKRRMEEIGTEVRFSTPAELAASLQAETEKWAPIIKAANIKPE